MKSTRTIAQVRLQGSTVGEALAVNALDLQALVPSDTRPENTRPRNHATDSGHVRNCINVREGQHGNLQYPNTVPASPFLSAAIKDRSENAPQNMTQTHGRPSLRVLPNIFGAWPRAYSPYSVRDDTNRSAHPADHALVKRAALTMDGSTEIPEFWNSVSNVS